LFEAIVTFSLSKTSSFDCRDVIFQRKIDLCKVTEFLKASMFIDIFMKNIRNFTNFDLQCPYRAGHYKITNYTMSYPQIMPFPMNSYICLKMKMFVKPFQAKKFEQYVTLNIAFSNEERKSIAST
jgi:Protein of unknown function (DUF1091)